ncbi:alpha-amylase family protein [Streptomyces lydicamycinicus]|uniref:Alpha-amylase n=1 Tax=Streptomyces lydicamycinicus TaxID=1546107 RepID=A0A0P4R9Y5_9ACTN|nr:alpha-amylase family protein [Streptomyces lydicamycinicus]USA00187.1 alpha-amylase family protein [Streptomyces lydicamycinicus]GAO10295.1 alpha-amylase [Streptomyces lydicamycinicus]
MQQRSRVLGGALAGVLAAAGLATFAPWSSQATPPGEKTVTATLFEWKYADVAKACTDELGPAGYGYVEVSPASEHIQGNQWWTSYQPVSYRIAGRLGNRAAFASMVSACHGAGVKVVADAVINHMAAGSGTGTGGTKYTKYDYPGTYQDQDFHGCRKSISDYGDRNDVQTCELVGLADLDTGRDYVRTTIAKYLDDLRSLGVDGFRVDAAKHISAADLAAVKSKMRDPGYWVQEVIHGAGEAVQPEEYTGNGDVDEFRYGHHLKSAFQGGSLAQLKSVADGKLDSDKARTFVDNWDTERNGSTLTYKDGAAYTLANVFMLASPYGSPNVYSGYEWSDKDAGPPSGNNGWTRQHAKRAVTGMVGFRNAVGSAKLTDWWDNGGSAIAFGRDGKGFVALNNGAGELKQTFATSLPAGTYCNVVAAAPSSCDGHTVTVGEDGKARLSVPARGAVALHIAR